MLLDPDRRQLLSYLGLFVLAHSTAKMNFKTEVNRRLCYSSLKISICALENDFNFSMVTVKRQVNNDTKGRMCSEQSGYAAAIMNSLNLSCQVSVSFLSGYGWKPSAESPIARQPIKIFNGSRQVQKTTALHMTEDLLETSLKTFVSDLF